MNRIDRIRKIPKMGTCFLTRYETIVIGRKMMYKVIKTEAEYEQALKEAETLIELDPESGTEDGDRLELLTLLISTYEESHFPLPLGTKDDSCSPQRTRYSHRSSDSGTTRHIPNRKISRAISGSAQLTE
jgi:hypothetical protein